MIQPVIRLKVPFLILLQVVLLLPTGAEALGCNSLWSLRNGGGLACDDAGLNTLYDNPTVATAGTGPLLGLFAPKCADGTNSCAGNEVRCMDGTRPIYYVDPAEDANGLPLISNRWIFWTTGGGTCIDGMACGNQYFNGNHAAMTSASASRYRSEAGIFSNEPTEPNLFRHYNRVYLRKCTNDRLSGAKTHNGIVVNGGGDTVDLFAHGHFMWQAVFNDLVTSHPSIGKKYYTGACVTDCDNSCPPNTTCDWLPNLSNATKIVLIGWSGGATGLINQLDTMVPDLQLLAPNADIRAVFDGRFNPSLDVQAAFWADTNPVDGLNDYTQCAAPAISPNCIDANLDGIVSHDESLNAPDNSYSSLFNTPGELPLNAACPACGLDYSTFHFRIGQRAWQAHDFLGYPLDSSCEDEHGIDAPECLEPMHVLMNHVATPHFIRVALED
ncbi:MAG: pectin acetylesterase-family hydrolase, partial [Acidobacteriota bacterium]